MERARCARLGRVVPFARMPCGLIGDFVRGFMAPRGSSLGGCTGADGEGAETLEEGGRDLGTGF